MWWSWGFTSLDYTAEFNGDGLLMPYNTETHLKVAIKIAKKKEVMKTWHIKPINAFAFLEEIYRHLEIFEHFKHSLCSSQHSSASQGDVRHAGGFTHSSQQCAQEGKWGYWVRVMTVWLSMPSLLVEFTGSRQDWFYASADLDEIWAIEILSAAGSQEHGPAQMSQEQIRK